MQTVAYAPKQLNTTFTGVVVSLASCLSTNHRATTATTEAEGWEKDVRNVQGQTYLLTYSVLGRIFVFIPFIICRFYRAPETQVGN